ncbi:MAG: hypothetical protein ACREQA_16700 [Candidatus Binatia bacterium]
MGHDTFKKRQKELARRAKQQKKAARRMERRSERANVGKRLEEQNPHIVGIVSGPQTRNG